MPRPAQPFGYPILQYRDAPAMSLPATTTTVAGRTRLAVLN